MTRTKTSSLNVPIIIGSCKKYNSVFKKVYQSIKFYLPNQTVHVISDVSIDVFQGDRSVLSKDRGWNQNLLELLEDFDPTDYVILTMDDLLFTSSSEESFFTLTIKSLIQADYDYVSLYAPPAVKLKRAVRTNFNLFSNISPDHSISAMVSLIRVNLLREILISTNSPWEFEQNSYKFLNNYRAVNLNYNLVNVSNLIVQGKKISWRNKNQHITSMELLYSVKYFLKVLTYSFKHLSGLKFIKFLLK